MQSIHYVTTHNLYVLSYTGDMQSRCALHVCFFGGGEGEGR